MVLHAAPRTSLLHSVIAAGAALGVAACGGAPRPDAAAPIAPGNTGGAEVAATGTSGLPGLDWGASADAVLAAYPRGTADDAGVVYLGTVEGHPAITRFAIDAGGLREIDVEWTDGFVSMDDCGATWKELRATLDGRLGASQADNLAAYWELPTASVTLACNPNDLGNGSAVLSQTYVPRQPE